VRPSSRPHTAHSCKSEICPHCRSLLLFNDKITNNLEVILIISYTNAFMEARNKIWYLENPQYVDFVCYMFLSPPRPLVAEPSRSQLLRFGTLFHKISGYYHPLALSNAVSKLIFFPTPASHFPTLLYASASDSSLLEFVRYIN